MSTLNCKNWYRQPYIPSPFFNTQMKFSTTTTPTDPAAIANAIKNIKHDGVQQYGPETWELLVKTASSRMNKFMDLSEQSDLRPSGADTSKTSYFGQRIHPAELHKKFKDMSNYSGEERLHHYQRLWLSACDFRPKMFPKSPAVTRWLSGLILLVMAMVSAGGVTRLTKSGLSMTHWKFTGEGRPSSSDAWDQEFEVYKQSPEWRLHNQDMTIEEFKFIYDMEYGHRTLGRTIGVAFALPFIYFLARGRISMKEPFGKALLGTLSLGGLQGLIGWWMVKSGLDEEANQTKARVSPYRLATHLIIAFTLLVGLTTLRLRAGTGKVETFFNGKPLPKAGYFGYYLPTRLAHSLAAFSFITAMSGAFVAGNEAGLVYNEWPRMGTGFVPSDLFSPHMSLLQNTFENPTFVQFTHRCLAYTTFAISWTTALKCLFNRQCPQIVAKSAFAAATVATFQASLGVATLINQVPVDLAACHQAGAMVLLMASTRLMYYTNNPVLAVPHIAKSLESNKLLYEDMANRLDSQPAKVATSLSAPVAQAVTKPLTVNKSAGGLLALAGAGLFASSYFPQQQQQQLATPMVKPKYNLKI